MVKEYTIDEKLQKRLMKTQYKKHPKWKKRTKVRIILYLSTILAMIIFPRLIVLEQSIINQSFTGEVTKIDIMLDNFIVSLVGFFFVGTPTLLYYKSLRNTCSDELDVAVNEYLMLTEEGIENGFFPEGTGNIHGYQVTKIAYGDITRMVLNKYHERITVYGDIKVIMYDNYKENIVRFVDEQKGGSRRFYLYYYNSEDFVNTLCKRTNIELEVIDYPEE